MVCIDPTTGGKTPEPLLTLRELRGPSMTFGSYASFSEELLIDTKGEIDSEDGSDIGKLDTEDKIYSSKELDSEYKMRSEDRADTSPQRNVVQLRNGLEVKFYFK